MHTLGFFMYNTVSERSGCILEFGSDQGTAWCIQKVRVHAEDGQKSVQTWKCV